MRPRTLNEITITTVWPYEGAKPVSDKDRIAALEEAVRVLGAECRAWRLPYGAETRPGTNRRLAIRDARAATDANPIAAEAAKKEPTK